MKRVTIVVQGDVDHLPASVVEVLWEQALKGCIHCTSVSDDYACEVFMRVDEAPTGAEAARGNTVH